MKIIIPAVITLTLASTSFAISPKLAAKFVSQKMNLTKSSSVESMLLANRSMDDLIKSGGSFTIKNGRNLGEQAVFTVGKNTGDGFSSTARISKGFFEKGGKPVLRNGVTVKNDYSKGLSPDEIVEFLSKRIGDKQQLIRVSDGIVESTAREIGKAPKEFLKTVYRSNSGDETLEVINKGTGYELKLTSKSAESVVVPFADLNVHLKNIIKSSKTL